MTGVAVSAWVDFAAATQGRAVRPLCRRALELSGPGSGRLALDLGCGGGVETAALLAQGWRVWALDQAPGVGELVRAGVPGSDRLTVVRGAFQDVVLPEAALVHASYSLPFLAPAEFGPVWQRVRRSLAPGGLLAVTLLGDRDSWRDRAEVTVLGRRQAQELFSGLDLLGFDEAEWEGPARGGAGKHWHVFEAVARRPGGAGPKG